MPAPSKPAPASGPGALAKRTDGGPAAKQKISVPTGMPYGDATALRATEKSAPMAATPSPSAAGSGASGGLPAPFTGVPFDAPTQNPGEPVTAGSPTGPGPGPEALQAQPQANSLSNFLASIAGADMTGATADLYQIAQRQGL